jgi:hypothetical protein
MSRPRNTQEYAFLLFAAVDAPMTNYKVLPRSMTTLRIFLCITTKLLADPDEVTVPRSSSKR